PGFWNRVVEAGLLKSWNGVSVDRALTMSVDGVTGATYSSRAVIENVRAGVGYVVNQHEVSQRGDMEWNVAWVAALLVVLMAAVVPLKVKSQRYRAVQELLNVAVLGFWTGTFVNYTMLLNFMSNGVHSMAALTGVVMLVVAFLYPQLGRSGHYCAWVCPLGSLQDLAGKCSPYKLHIGRRTATVLSWVRRMVWCALLMCMWLGVWVSWIDYELFSAFVVGSAPVWMIVAGVVVVLLSVVVPRPYCRFLCPTGTLLRLSQNIESTNV
ncbi:MAG: 4Fe-4S binding protein, partial [Paramuribaculum sp.]|nr:4Fe-4S binding protein [Paramuribaculum sp.]